MRPNGFGGPYSRPQPSVALPGHSRQDARLDQPGDLLPAPDSAGAATPAQNGSTSQTTPYGTNPGGPPKPGLPSGSAVGGFSNISLNGGPPQFAQYYSKPPVGGGEYVQHQTRQQQPPGPSAAPAGQLPSMPPKVGFGARGPPAFGKGAPAPPTSGARPLGVGNAGRPASPSSPNKYASIPMPGSPSPTTAARAVKLSQQQAAQMPLPPTQPRGLAPPSFSMPQQVCTATQTKPPRVQLPMYALYDRV